MKLNSYSLAAFVLILLFGGITFTSAMNWWQTESTKVPATYAEGDLAGQYNPADIRGSYTFGEVSELFEIPLSDLKVAFRLPNDIDPAGYPLKSLEEQFANLPVEMGTGSVRLFTAFYNGLPIVIDTEEETYLFPEAAEVLRANGKMTSEQAAYLENHVVQEAEHADADAEAADAEAAEAEGAAVVAAAAEGAEAEGAAAVAAAAEAPVVNDAIVPTPTEHAPPADTVTGKTTFQNLLDWGMTQEKIEEILGTDMPIPSAAIKDYVTSQGLEFPEMKAKIQAELDQTQ